MFKISKTTCLGKLTFAYKLLSIILTLFTQNKINCLKTIICSSWNTYATFKSCLRKTM